MSIRQNRSAEISAAINQQFYNIIRLSEQADQITEIGYQSTQLLQDIEENLPNLPTTRENKMFNLMQHSKQQIINKNKIGIRLNKRSSNVFNKLSRSINKVKAKKQFFLYKTPILMCLKQWHGEQNWLSW